MQRISRTYPDTPDQLQADAIPSRNCACLARFAWSSDESARHSAIHELTTGFFCAAASIMSMRGHSTNRSVSRKQPCESCTLPKGSISVDGAYDPKTKEEMASIAHPESYYQCVSYCSLRLRADVPFASCTSCHVFASVRGRIRRQGATCTPKTRIFSHGVTLGT